MTATTGGRLYRSRRGPYRPLWLEALARPLWLALRPWAALAPLAAVPSRCPPGCSIVLGPQHPSRGASP